MLKQKVEAFAAISNNFGTPTIAENRPRFQSLLGQTSIREE